MCSKRMRIVPLTECSWIEIYAKERKKQRSAKKGRERDGLLQRDTLKKAVFIVKKLKWRRRIKIVVIIEERKFYKHLFFCEDPRRWHSQVYCEKEE
jgi:hypothetical protein